MSSHLGLAFSAENISYVHLDFVREYQKFILNRAGTISYPFDYDEREFFKEENLVRLSHLIQKSLTGLQIDAHSVAISIESNLAKIKRVTLPPNLDEKGEFEHINWDLAQSLSLPLDEYVYHIAPNHFEYDSIYDTLVIVIQKKIIDFFVKFAKHLNVKLNNLSVHSLAAEVALRNTSAGDLEGLVVLFKISLQRLETIFIWNGNYFSSEYELIQIESTSYSYNEIVLDRIKLKIKQIENLFQQFGRESAQVNQIFLYGENITESIVELISKNISVPVNRLNPTANLTFSENFQNKTPQELELTRYVECIGVVLDI